ncbi:MAG: hypothetical protein ABWX68_08230 [Arthrobacter sp.]|uniref:hypothetical protein n=1 Tax=Arthrobacter sp. TaxID=1667 RepID=UPI00348EC6B3
MKRLPGESRSSYYGRRRKAARRLALPQIDEPRELLIGRALAAMRVRARRARSQREWMSTVLTDHQLPFRDPRYRKSVRLVAQALAWTAVWEGRDAMTTRAGWFKLCELSGVSRSTLAVVLAWLQERGYLALVETGTTRPIRVSRHFPRIDPHADQGNRAAEYLLTVPLAPLPAVAPKPAGTAGEDQEAEQDAAQGVEAEDARMDALLARIAEQAGELPPLPPEPDTVPQESPEEPAAPATEAVDEAVETGCTCLGPLPPEALPLDKEISMRARAHDVRGCRCARETGHEPDKYTDKRTKDASTRAGWAAGVWPGRLSERPPAGRLSRRDRLAAAEQLRAASPLFRRSSEKALRSRLTPCWRAGWSNYDVMHAMRERPDGSGWAWEADPTEIRNPDAWIAFRLAAWIGPDGTMLVGITERLEQRSAAQKAVQEAERAERAAREAGRAVHGRGEDTLPVIKQARALLEANRARCRALRHP